jgi:uncharacterized membrane protein
MRTHDQRGRARQFQTESGFGPPRFGSANEFAVVAGAVTGAVAGAVTGAVAGAVTGAVAGAVTGAMAGAVTGAVATAGTSASEYTSRYSTNI